MTSPVVLGASRETGAALIVSLLATTLIAAIGLGLVTMSTIERAVAGYARESGDGLYAAEAIVHRALDDLWTAPEWHDAVSGLTRSSFVDGSTNPVTSSGPIDLLAITAAFQSRSDDEGRWGLNNPVWRLYAYGPFDRLVGATLGTPAYLIAWVADDPAELDDNPASDSNGVVLVRGRALGRGGLVREVQTALKRMVPYSSGPSEGPPTGGISGPSPRVGLARILRDPVAVVGSRQVTSPAVQILAWREVR